MSKFCTACGQPLTPDSAFCEECGKPVIPPAPAVTPLPPSPALGWPRARLVKGGVIAIMLLVFCGTGLYFLLRETPTPSNTAMAELINDNVGLIQRLSCLNNFNYEKTPVNIASHDNDTRRLLDYLVSSGLYAGPEHLTQNRGFFFEELYRYEHTEAIKAFLKGNTLCFASGIKVNRVSYDQIDRSSEMPQVTGKVYYAYAEPAPWSHTEEAREIFPEQLAADEQRHIDVHLHLKDGKWLLGPAPNAKPASKTNSSQTTAQIPGSGILDGLSSLFGSNPAQEIIGVWSLRDAVLVEFSAKQVSINGETESATYRKEGKTIIVSVAGEEALRVEPLGQDTVRIRGFGGRETQLVFHRVN